MIRSLILMFQFMTRLPIPIEIEMDKETISKGIIFLPLVGMVVGAISWVVYYLLSFINTDIAALGAVIANVAATGGLHIDGLSDTCDGFFSARSRERILEIMKDSRVGTFGVIAIVMTLLAKYTLISNLPQDMIFSALILASGASRFAASFLITFGKSARPGGLGDMFSSSSSKAYFWLSAGIFSAIGIILGGWAFIKSLVVILAFGLLLMRRSYRIIGGLTGDVYGAAIEISDILGLITFLVVGAWI
mgnify:FL=1